MNKWIEMYNRNGVPKRVRPATAKVKGPCNSRLVGNDESFKELKQRIVNDDKYSTNSKIYSEVSKSSQNVSKFMFKPYATNHNKFSIKRKSANPHSSRVDSSEMYSKISNKNKRVNQNRTTKNKSFTVIDHVFIL